MIVASMTITDERKKAVDFSDPYYDVPSRFVAKAGRVQGRTRRPTLKGKKIIVLRNSAARQVRGRATTRTARSCWSTRRPTSTWSWSPAAATSASARRVVSSEAFLKKPEGKGFAQVGPTVRLDGGGGGVGIALRKGEDALRDKVNAALKAIRADGTYKSMAEATSTSTSRGGN